MMRRLFVSLGALALVTGFIATPRVSAQQSVSLYIGGFTPRGEDARGTDDVLFRNRDFLVFDIDDFKGVTAGGEWLVALGDRFDVGLGVGVYTRTARAVYTEFVNVDRTEIEQDLKLRVVPFTATIRVLPLGHHDAFEPYVGAGVGIYAWRYSETGQFVNLTDLSIFRDSFAESSTSVGPVVLGGVRVPIGPVGIGGEIRYQGGKGDLPADLRFAGNTIDLGGLNYLATVSVRF